MKRIYYLFPAGLIGVVALVMGAAQIFAPDMAAGLKEEIETQGAAMTGAPVTVERVELSPVTGEGRLIGLIIGNPPGYRTPAALRLGEVKVRIDPRVLRISPVIIRAIDIRYLTVTIEGGLGGNNLSALVRNVGSFLKESEAAKPVAADPGADAVTASAADPVEPGSVQTENKPEEAATAPGKKTDQEAESSSSPRIIVKDINIIGGQVVLAPRLLMGATMTNSLKNIHMKDVGAENGGASVGELVSALVNAIMIGVGDTAGQEQEEPLDDSQG